MARSLLRSDRVLIHPAVAMVVALSLVSVAGRASGAVSQAPAEAVRASIPEGQTTRLMAAAVAAARDLLGLGHAAGGIELSPSRLALPSSGAVRLSPATSETAWSRPLLRPSLTDLPPPLCI